MATTGDNSNTCSAPSSPCASINGALGQATAGDTILVAEGTYTGTTTVNKSITLSGGWDSTFASQTGYSTLDGQYLARVINISNTSLSTPSVTLNHFIVKRGTDYAGAGIYIAGSSVVLDNMLIFDNKSLGTASGGGIFIYSGPLTVNNSFLYGNKASTGGAIASSGGDVTINNSTLFLNTATSATGYGNGGGIYMYYGNKTLSIANSTISRNIGKSYGGAMDISFTNIQLKNVTISENYSLKGPSFPAISTFSIVNSIIANNVSGSDITTDINQQCLIGYGPTIDQYSIVYNSRLCNIPSQTRNIDPQLGYFSSTKGYQALQAGSPAINSGNPAICTGTDQRGVARPVGGACDVGAYEYAPAGSLTSSS